MSAGAIDRKPINNQRHTDAVGKANWYVFGVFICDFEDLNSVLVSQTCMGQENILRLVQKQAIYNQFCILQKLPRLEDGLLQRLWVCN